MRRSTAQPIGDVLKDVVEKLSRARKKDTAKIFSRWNLLVGKELSRHSRPVSLRRGTLKVIVADSSWLYQVNLEKEKLLKSLQKKIGAEKVQKIQFMIGKI